MFSTENYEIGKDILAVSLSGDGQNHVIVAQISRQ